ncbi:MAG: Nuclease SbcCD subunit D [Firmicutes bacterium]|nr:Nuclease SbcCD subunit D [Bacillota bacterium]
MNKLRLLHTSDWHLGRTLEGRSRYAEQVQVINEIVDIADEQDVHIVLIAGDVFDTYNPSAEAQELYCTALEKLAHDGRRCVLVVAGNHDSPERLCAIRPLAERQGILIAGRPQETLITNHTNTGVKVVKSGPGWVEIAIPGLPYHAIISHLPYPSESRLGRIISPELQEGKLRAAYAETVIDLLNQQAQAFRPDTVNLAISHLLTLGGQQSDSERSIEIGGASAVSANCFPETAQYIALGHLHRPQQVQSARQKTYYSGSPLAYSFSESGQTKVVYVAEILPGGEAAVKSVSLTAGIPLERWRCFHGVAEARHRLEELRGKSLWLEIEVHAAGYLTGKELSSLHQAHAGLLKVRCIVPTDASEVSAPVLADLTLEEMFLRFYRQRRGGVVPKEELVKMFAKFAGETFVGGGEG